MRVRVEVRRCLGRWVLTLGADLGCWVLGLGARSVWVPVLGAEFQVWVVSFIR